jgi:hypothetical protein
MKTQYQPLESTTPGGCAQRALWGVLFGRPELDTYKQFAQVNNHAGFSLFWGFPNTLRPRPIYALFFDALRTSCASLSGGHVSVFSRVGCRSDGFKKKNYRSRRKT